MSYDNDPQPVLQPPYTRPRVLAELKRQSLRLIQFANSQLELARIWNEKNPDERPIAPDDQSEALTIREDARRYLATLEADQGAETDPLPEPPEPTKPDEEIQ